jgi:hypothetical protein
MTAQRLMRAWTLGCAVLLTLAACDGKETIAPTENYDVARRGDLVYTWGPYQLVSSDNWNLIKISAVHIIGPEGGRLALGLDELVVPAGAVRSPTIFKMTREIGPYVLVDLNAYDRRTGAVVDTFERPLELKLSYRFSRVSEAEMNRLVVVWLKDNRSDGELVPMPTRVIPARRQIVGTLTHFSQYAMGMN